MSRFVVAIIRFRFRGDDVVWPIGADRERDTEQTLREHLERYYPGAEFQGFHWEEEAPPSVILSA